MTVLNDDEFGWKTEADPDSLLRWLSARCAELAEDPKLRSKRDVFVDIVSHVAEPLRVAVTGDVSTGKSTLINALVGQTVAEVQSEETTAEATWFRHPSVIAPPPLGRGHRSRPLMFPLASVVTLVDTPGMNTASEHALITEEMLDASKTAAGAVTVLVYLCHNGNLSDMARKRIKKFAVGMSGPLNPGAGVVLVGAKADAIAQGDPDELTKLVDNLRTQGGPFAGVGIALSPILAASSRCGQVDDWLVDQIRLIASVPDLRVAATYSWGVLKTYALIHAPDLVDRLVCLERLSGTTLGIHHAVKLAVLGVPDLAAGIARLWEEVSGLAELETLLRRLADDRSVLTVSAVSGRLHHLAAALGYDRGRPVRRLYEELQRHPGMVGHERRAAALMLDSDGAMVCHIPLEDRRAAAALLRGSRTTLSDAETKRWEHRAGPGQKILVGRLAHIVLKAHAHARNQP